MVTWRLINTEATLNLYLHSIPILSTFKELGSWFLWPLGIIENLIVGSDGVARGAKLRAGKSYVERAIKNFTPWNYRVTDSCQHRRRGWTQRLLHFAQNVMLQLQRVYVYKRLPKKKSEMDNLNEQCYQLEFSWRTDTIETVVLFTLREMIVNVMSVIILFEADRAWEKKHISPPEIYGGVCREYDFVIKVSHC